MPRRAYGFAVRLAMATSCLVLLACATLAGLLVRRDLEESRRALAARGRTIAESLARESELAVLSNDDGTMLRLGRIARAERDVVYCRFFDKHGAMLASTGESAGDEVLVESGPGHPDPLPVGDDVWEFRAAVVTADLRPQAGELALLGAPRGGRARRERVGTAAVGLSLTPLVAHRNQLILTAGVVTAGVTLVGVLGAALLATAITRPLKALARATRALADGDAVVAVDAAGRDEVGDLARSFNVMVASLAQSRAALEEYSRTLEDKVQARTERLEALNRELAEANRLKSEFLATVSHELRTPLNVIMGYTQMLAEGASGPVTAEQADLLEAIARYSTLQLDLVTNVLDYSRLASGRVSVQVRRVSLDGLLADVCALHRGRFAKPGIELVCEVAPELPDVHTDGVKLQEIVRNLVENAFKFTERGRITVRASSLAGGERIRIAVEDTGSGIDPEQLAYVFDEFRQLGETSTRGTGGVGLGLSIVKRLVDVLGGTIRVTSVPGVGSTFEVELPRRCPPHPSTPSMAA